jgi:hypothetical protein
MIMTKAAYLLKLPISMKASAERLAKEDGISLNQWIAVAIAQKIGAVETAADFLKTQSGSARTEVLMPFLKNTRNDRPPVGDEI